MLRYAFSYIIVAGKVLGQFLKRNKLKLVLIAFLFLLSNVHTEKYDVKLEKYNSKQIDNSLIDEESNDTSSTVTSSTVTRDENTRVIVFVHLRANTNEHSLLTCSCAFIPGHYYDGPSQTGC